jgi:putative redox protein
MPAELVIDAEYEGGMRVRAYDGKHSVLMDYPLQDGQPVAGMTPLELLLCSLAGCIGNTLPLLLARRGQHLTGFQVAVRGRRRDEHPAVLTSIEVELVLRGRDLDLETVAHAATLAEERLCPVWAMIRPACPIVTKYRTEA